MVGRACIYSDLSAYEIWIERAWQHHAGDMHEQT